METKFLGKLMWEVMDSAQGSREDSPEVVTFELSPQGSVTFPWARVEEVGGVVLQAWGAVNKTWDVTVRSQSGITCGVHGGGWREIQLEWQVRVRVWRILPARLQGLGFIWGVGVMGTSQAGGGHMFSFAYYKENWGDPLGHRLEGRELEAGGPQWLQA